MSFDFNNDTPIYLQIIEHIKTMIISKKYLPNQKLPSVRDLSLFFEVNPNTIQKALSELENMGLIYTERTNGKFVTENEKIIEKITNETLRKMIDNFYESMEKIGLDKKQVLDLLKNEEEL